MSNDNKIIHDFDLDLICEFFSALHRQGPGNEQATLKALGFIANLTEQSLVADIGCGTGGQTMTLAQHLPSRIVALDMFPRFISMLNDKVRVAGLQDRVEGIVGSMDDLPFEKQTLDLIWSEGAIYNIGFQRGLNEWREYLKTDGYIAVSETSWFTDDRPQEINDFWQNSYPEIDTIGNQMNKIYKAGYSPIAAFVLPETCWTDHYYTPKMSVENAFIDKYAGNKAVEEFIDSQRHEARLYAQYKAFYGYTFFIAQKR